jgi:hypothetical protein
MPHEENSEKRSLLWLWLLLGCGGFAAVLVVALAAVVLFTSGRSGRHSGQAPTSVAASSLKMYAAGQAMYRRLDLDGDGKASYASQLPSMHRAKDSSGNPIGLLRDEMVAAYGPNGTPNYGYVFLEMKTIAGKPIDWSKDYALCALPSPRRGSWTPTLIISTSGKIYSKDQGKDGTFVDDFPANPTAAGWGSDY